MARRLTTTCVSAAQVTPPPWQCFCAKSAFVPAEFSSTRNAKHFFWRGAD